MPVPCAAGRRGEVGSEGSSPRRSSSPDSRLRRGPRPRGAGRRVLSLARREAGPTAIPSPMQRRTTGPHGRPAKSAGRSGPPLGVGRSHVRSGVLGVAGDPVRGVRRGARRGGGGLDATRARGQRRHHSTRAGESAPADLRHGGAGRLRARARTSRRRRRRGPTRPWRARDRRQRTGVVRRWRAGRHRHRPPRRRPDRSQRPDARHRTPIHDGSEARNSAVVRRASPI